MKKAILAGVTAAAVLGSSAVYAQHRFHSSHHHFSVEDHAAFIDARIAAVKAGLQLTPDQEKNWSAVETAVRDFIKQRAEMAKARASERDLQGQAPAANGPGDQAAADRRDPVTRLRERSDNLAATAAGLKKIADAADPLYKSLDDNQKRRLATLTRMGRFGWDSGRRFGRDRSDRDHGPDRDRDHGGPERL